MKFGICKPSLDSLLHRVSAHSDKKAPSMYVCQTGKSCITVRESCTSAITSTPPDAWLWLPILMSQASPSLLTLGKLFWLVWIERDIQVASAYTDIVALIKDLYWLYRKCFQQCFLHPEFTQMHLLWSPVTTSRIRMSANETRLTLNIHAWVTSHESDHKTSCVYLLYLHKAWLLYLCVSLKLACKALIKVMYM